jgi:proton glutamate symport protein
MSVPTPPSNPLSPMKRIPLHVQILLALALAVLCGLLLGDAHIGSLTFVGACAFVGELFLRALKMLVVPLVVTSIVTGVAGIGSVQGFGRLGLKTLTYYVLTTLIAALLGLCLVNIIHPGVSGTSSGRAVPEITADAKARLTQMQGRGLADVAMVFQRFIPDNVVKSAVEGDMLGLIFFSLVFGYFITRLPAERHTLLMGLFQGIYDVMILITDVVMRFAPLGVFALVAKVVATTGLDAFRQVALFAVTVLTGLLLHMFGVLSLLLRMLAGVNPWRHVRAMVPAILTAFSTASSSATLPMTMECVEKRAGVSNRTASFVVPLGATVNMNGTALYECVAAIFIAQCYGVSLSFTAQFTVVLLAVVTSIGVPGVPAASLVAIVIILNAVGLPAEGIGLILAVDRVLDMCRTVVNIYGDACGAVIIARSEGETGILEKTAAKN